MIALVGRSVRKIQSLANGDVSEDHYSRFMAKRDAIPDGNLVDIVTTQYFTSKSMLEVRSFSTNALWFLVLLLWQIFSELFQGLWKHSGESQGTQDEFLATYNDHAPGGSCS